MRRRPPNQSERSAIYGELLDPLPVPTYSAVRDASGERALTAHERDEREARRTTTPAPRARRRRAGRALFHVDGDASGEGT